MSNAHPYGISYTLSDDLAAYRDLFLKHCGKPERYPHTRVLTETGQKGSPMYYLLSGMIKIYTMNPSGYMRILGYHRQNTLFAMDRIVSETACVVTTEAVTDVVVLPVTWENLNRMSAQEPNLMPALVQYYGKVLRLMCFDAEIKSIDNVAARLASFLCLMTSDDKKEKLPSVRLTQEELAFAVNASRVQIARVASRFKREGLIETHRGRIVLLDREGLMHMSKDIKNQRE